MSFAGKRILLVVGGGIAAYKSLELIRRLRERGAAVRVILTEAGSHFVTELSLASLSGDKVYRELFDLTSEAEMGHIVLSRQADAVVVAPATADLLAKLASGPGPRPRLDRAARYRQAGADRACYECTDVAARGDQRNLAQLEADGIAIVGPNDGDMACGEFGPGRMAEPEEIVSAIAAMLDPDRRLSGLKALVTAGPTLEPIDPVRFISNRSSGKQGYAIAEALRAAGAETALISGPVSLPAPAGVKLIKVETARQMLAATEAELPADIAVCAAAVADWRPANPANAKLKKRDTAPSVALTENADILATLARHATRRPALVVGFAAETDDLLANAEAKLRAKGVRLDRRQRCRCWRHHGRRHQPRASHRRWRKRNLAANVQARGGPPPSGPHCRAFRKGGGMKIAIRRLPHAADLPLPAYATAGSAGLDLLAVVTGDMVLSPGRRHAVACGIALSLPPGVEAQVRPRSGLALRHGVTVLNAPGTIDSDYRGEVAAILINHGEAPFTITRGLKIAQLVIAAHAKADWSEADHLDASVRGAGGFGSTGL